MAKAGKDGERRARSASLPGWDRIELPG